MFYLRAHVTSFTCSRRDDSLLFASLVGDGKGWGDMRVEEDEAAPGEEQEEEAARRARKA